LRIITGLLTGHGALNRQLTVMKIRTDPLCLICGKEEETVRNGLPGPTDLELPDGGHGRPI